MKKKRNVKPATVILILAFIAGVVIMLYPSFANLWNSMYQKRLVTTYEEDTEALVDAGEVSYEYEYEKARAYNDELWPTPNPEAFTFLNEEDPSPEYMECLNINGDGIMGYVEIPKIDIEIPIYHSTNEEDLLTGAGHLEGTSLPIGGESTHSVIAAHRGLPGSMLFTDLDEMEIGDHFLLHVLDDTLCYEVESIDVVLPEEVSDLVIQEGRDLCTLLTCTPYGVNTHRLLVTGHRVPYDDSMLDEEAPFQMTPERWLMLFAIIVAAVGIFLLAHSRRKRNKAQAAAEQENIERESKDT